MLKAFLMIDEETPLSDVTGIAWLDAALVLAAYLLEEENGSVAESGKALVLKTSEANSYVSSNLTTSAMKG